PSRRSRSGSGSATRRSRSATCAWRRRSSPRAACYTPPWRGRNTEPGGAAPAAGDVLHATVAVTNTGAVAGDDVVQLYVEAPGSAVPRAPRELKGFARVTLEAGETKEVTIAVPATELAYYDAEDGWVLEPLEYVAVAARHSRDPEARRAPFGAG